jgi:hypothetical protein
LQGGGAKVLHDVQRWLCEQVAEALAELRGQDDNVAQVVLLDELAKRQGEVFG